MGSLELSQIRTKLNDEYKELIKIEGANETLTSDQEKNYFSKALAAYSISVLYPEVDKNQVVYSIVDGTDDNGIDLIYYNHETNELCLVQSKYNENGTKEPSLGDIQKFTTGVKDLINLKFDKFNSKVNARKEEIINVLKISKLKLKVVLVYTAINFSSHSQREITDLLIDLNDHRDVADFELINQGRLHSSLYNQGDKRNIDIEVTLKQWGRYDGEIEAFHGEISGTQILELWNTYGNTLFDSNIRKVLGNTDINKEIKKTLDTQPEFFWYYNNGITLICEEVEKQRIHGNSRDIGVFDCKNISIVNGAQTVGILGKYGQASEESRDKLAEANVAFRIISITRADEDGNLYVDNNFANEVTTKNNKQNRIGSRDFLVLDPLQRKTERELSIEGITYHLMRGEEEDNIGDNSFNVREATRALSFAKDIDATIIARREVTSIYDDLESPVYKKIYNSGLTSFYVWNCVRIQRMIENSIEVIQQQVTEDREKAVLIYGKEVMSKIIYDEIRDSNIPRSSLDISRVPIIHTDELMTKLKVILGLILENLPEEKEIINIFKSPVDMRNIYSEVSDRLGLEVDETQDQSLDIYAIEGLDNKTRNQIEYFTGKIQGNTVAEGFVIYWIKEIFDPNSFFIEYRSNVHVFRKATQKEFLFRMAYYTKFIVSFEFYASKYKSYLFDNVEFRQWAEEHLDDKGRIYLDTQEDVENLKGILGKVMTN